MLHDTYGMFLGGIDPLDLHVSFYNFLDMDQSVVAPVIYGNKPHRTTNTGVMISKYVAQELQFFLAEFNKSIGVERLPYYRIDAYFDDSMTEPALWILEINAAFVDGWGTALNLARAAQIPVSPKLLQFPQCFDLIEEVYRPELELFVRELNNLRREAFYVGPCNDTTERYLYGRWRRKDSLILPYDGVRLDNKLNLGLFSRVWPGELVRVPRHYISRSESWEEIPSNAVLKFCDKGGPECATARNSVIFDKPQGKASFLKRCYQDETLLAQDWIKPVKKDGNNCQLVIFAIGDEPITGYVQYSPNKLINDNSIHGPLWIAW